MKKVISTILCIIILFCVFTSATPSFALSYNGFSYEIENEKVVITGYDGAETKLIIPAQIDSKSVIKIENNAFKDNKNLTSVTISEGIEDIGESAFENCSSLSTISLPTTIVHIGKNAIYNTAYYNNKNNWKLKRENTSGGNVSVGGSGVQDTVQWEDILAPVLEYLYLGTALIECEYEGVYNIKQGTTIVADYAFAGCEKAKEITFPESLIAIGKYAFDGCVLLEKFDFSDNTEIHSTSFINTGFYNNPKNWENDSLYMGTRLVEANGEEIIVKDGTTQIVSGAINGENVVIPESVTSIAKDAFIHNTDVKIFGYSDTTAQIFATENKIAFVDLNNFTKGDVDFNGKLDADDYKTLCEIALIEKTPTFITALVGDMNEDGAIDGLDVVILDLFINDIGPSTIKGDADGNGVVDTDDYKLLVKIATLNTEITDVYMFDRCDLNYDGAVDSFDAIYLDLALNGLEKIA